MYLGHVSGRKVVPDCRRLGSSASDCRLQKGYPLCACQHTDSCLHYLEVSWKNLGSKTGILQRISRQEMERWKYKIKG